MKRSLLSLAAFAALGASALPATAQDWRGHGYEQRGRDGGRSQSPTAYADSFDWKINHAIDTRVIAPWEGQRLHWQVERVKSSAWRIQTGQAGPAESNRFYDTLAQVDARLSDSQRYVDQRRDYGDQRRYDYRR